MVRSWRQSSPSSTLPLPEAGPKRSYRCLGAVGLVFRLQSFHIACRTSVPGLALNYMGLFMSDVKTMQNAFGVLSHEMSQDLSAHQVSTDSVASQGTQLRPGQEKLGKPIIFG